MSNNLEGSYCSKNISKSRLVLKIDFFLYILLPGRHRQFASLDDKLVINRAPTFCVMQSVATFKNVPMTCNNTSHKYVLHLLLCISLRLIHFNQNRARDPKILCHHSPLSRLITASTSTSLPFPFLCPFPCRSECHLRFLVRSRQRTFPCARPTPHRRNRIRLRSGS